MEWVTKSVTKVWQKNQMLKERKTAMLFGPELVALTKRQEPELEVAELKC